MIDKNWSNYRPRFFLRGWILGALVLFVVSLAAISSVPYLVSQAQSSNQANSWTSFIGDYQDSRYDPGSGINSTNVDELKPAWFFSTGVNVSSLPIAYNASVTSQPIVANGSVFFSDWLANTYSVNLTTGTLNWEDHLSKGTISGTPEVVNGVDYIAELGPPTVYALNETTGKMIWSNTVSTSPYIGLWSSPVIYEGRLYIGLSSLGVESNASVLGELDALNATTGSTLWRFNAAPGAGGGAGVWGSVVVDPSSGDIFFGTGNPYANSNSSLYSDSMICLNGTTGSLIWYNQVLQNDQLDRDFGSTPNLFSLDVNGNNIGVVGLGSKDGYYYVFDRANGTLISKVYAGQIIGVAGFFGEGANVEIFIPGRTVQAVGVYLPNATCPGCGILSAYFPANKSIPWTFQTGDIVGSVALADGVVFFGDQNGNLYGLSTSSGNVLFNTTLPCGIWGGVTVADGYLITGTSASAPEITNGYDLGVYAYSLNPSSTTTFAQPPQTTSSPSTTTSSLSTISSSMTSSTTSSVAGGANSAYYYIVVVVLILIVGGSGFLLLPRRENSVR